MDGVCLPPCSLELRRAHDARTNPEHGIPAGRAAERAQAGGQLTCSDTEVTSRKQHHMCRCYLWYSSSRPTRDSTPSFPRGVRRRFQVRQPRKEHQEQAQDQRRPQRCHASRVSGRSINRPVGSVVPVRGLDGGAGVARVVVQLLVVYLQSNARFPSRGTIKTPRRLLYRLAPKKRATGLLIGWTTFFRGYFMSCTGGALARSKPARPPSARFSRRHTRRQGTAVTPAIEQSILRFHERLFGRATIFEGE